jgi:hypothetical protein
MVMVHLLHHIAIHLSTAVIHRQIPVLELLAIMNLG